MYCPRCLTPYRDGVLECADCRLPLVVELPPQPAAAAEVALVNVLEVRDSFALSLAKAALEDAGIHYLVSGEASHCIGGFQSALGLGAVSACPCSCRIHVASDSSSTAAQPKCLMFKELRFRKMPSDTPLLVDGVMDGWDDFSMIVAPAATRHHRPGRPFPWLLWPRRETRSPCR